MRAPVRLFAGHRERAGFSVRELDLPVGTREVGLVAAGLAAAGALFAQRLHAPMTYDESVYLASLRALQQGETLGEDVFASQPPGFYLLLRFAGFVVGDGLAELRLAVVVIAVLGCLAAYALARTLAGRAAGATAGVLLAVSPPYADQAATVSADLPAASFALIALALAGAAWGTAGSARTRLALSVLSGATLVVAVSIKLPALLALVAVGALVALLRPLAGSLAAWTAGGLALAGAFAVAHWGTLGELWRDAVTFHQDARGPHIWAPENTVGHAETIWNAVGVQRPPLWLALVAVLATIAGLARRRRPSPLWLWPLATAGFLLWHRPLFPHHVVFLAAALAVPVAVALAKAAPSPVLRRAIGAGIAVGLVVGAVQAGVSAAGTQSAEPPDTVAAAVIVHETTDPGDPVVTDVPSVALLADRRIPGELVDSSYVRVESGSLTSGDVLRVIDQTHAPVVVIGRALSDDSKLASELEARFRSRTHVGSLVVYLRVPS